MSSCMPMVALLPSHALRRPRGYQVARRGKPRAAIGSQWILRGGGVCECRDRISVATTGPRRAHRDGPSVLSELHLGPLVNQGDKCCTTALAEPSHPLIVVFDEVGPTSKQLLADPFNVLWAPSPCVEQWLVQIRSPHQPSAESRPETQARERR